MRGSAPGERRGGRQKGVPNRATIKRQIEVAASGLTPLEYMLQVMRDKKATQELRLDAAHKAAPFVHPRLSAVEHTGEMSIHTHEAALDELDAPGA